MSKFDRGCEWYCDNCDAHLNYQEGFDASSGEWECSNCGWLNDVSEANILQGDLLALVESAYEVCPECGAHMDTEDYKTYQCPDCGLVVY